MVFIFCEFPFCYIFFYLIGSFQPLQIFNKLEFCVDKDGFQTTGSYVTDDGLLPCYIEGCTEDRCFDAFGEPADDKCRFGCQPVCLD